MTSRSELSKSRSGSLDVTPNSKDAEDLLGEMEQVFADVVVEAESRTKLTNEQRTQTRIVIAAAMESVRRIVERLVPAESRGQSEG